MTQQIRRCVGAALTTAVLAVGIASPAAAAPSEPESTEHSLAAVPDWVIVRNDNSDKVIAIQGASKSPGAAAIQWPFVNNADSNDVMGLEFVGNLLRIKPGHTFSNDGNVHNDQCLAVAGASFALGAKIIQHTCTYDSVNNDVWQLRSTSNGYEFYNVNSHLCIVVSGASMSNGAALIQHNCNGTANSRWWITDI